MDKLYLEDIIEKYHLGGLVERIKIKVDKKTLTTTFLSNNKNLVGNIEAPDFELKNCEFGIYDTSQLLKLIGITDNFLVLDIEKNGKIFTKLLIADNEYNLEYVLADIMLTPNVPVIDEPDYTIIANIDIEFVNKFLKAKRALDTEVFTIEIIKNHEGNNVIKFTLGGTDGYSNKVNFTLLPTEIKILPGTVIKFPLIEFGEILSVNKTFSSGILRVSEEGLLKIEFETEKGLKSSYTLVGKE